MIPYSGRRYVQNYHVGAQGGFRGIKAAQKPYAGGVIGKTEAIKPPVAKLDT